MDALATAARALRAARGVVVLSGAGASAESGLPTFRDADGLWRGHDPLRLATPEGFERDPALVSEWYDLRRLAALAASPNAAHTALVDLERHVLRAGGRFCLLTQNVDGLHQRAGSKHVVELHGSITVWRDDRSGRTVVPGPEPLRSYPERGPDGGWLRPNVVWFGERLPDAALRAAEESLRWCEALVVVGTSALVYPAAGVITAAAAAGAVTIEVNREASAATVDVRLIGRAGAVVPQLVAAVVDHRV